MRELERFNDLIARFSAAADFLIIYIEEAHASDGWFFTNNIDIKRHLTFKDRVEAAKKLLPFKPNCPIVVDKMDDNANLKYGGLFERLYIVRDDVIQYEGGRGPSGYHLEEVENWLARNCA